MDFEDDYLKTWDFDVAPSWTFIAPLIRKSCVRDYCAELGAANFRAGGGPGRPNRNGACE